MTEENKQTELSTTEDTLFDDENVSEQLPEQTETPDDESEEEVWSPTVSSESPKEKLERKGVKEKADGRTLTIKSVEFTKPRQKDSEGKPIPPKETQTSGKPYYTGKLAVKFEEDNLIEYYPTMRYFVNNGIMSNNAKLNRTGKSEIAKLVKLVVAKIGRPTEEISDKEVLDFLIGKKVKISTEEDTFNGKAWFRNNIVEILD